MYACRRTSVLFHANLQLHTAGIHSPRHFTLLQLRSSSERVSMLPGAGAYPEPHSATCTQCACIKHALKLRRTAGAVPRMHACIARELLWRPVIMQDAWIALHHARPGFSPRLRPRQPRRDHKKVVLAKPSNHMHIQCVLESCGPGPHACSPHALTTRLAILHRSQLNIIRLGVMNDMLGGPCNVEPSPHRMREAPTPLCQTHSQRRGTTQRHAPHSQRGSP